MKKRSYYFFLLIFLILMILSLISILLWGYDNHKTSEIVKREEVHLIQKEDTYSLERQIMNDNIDTVGWIIVPGTNINYPVVQYEDNSYYLNHDFDNQLNSSGWIFLDSNNQMTDHNLVLYGHHRRDGSMFGSIDLLFNPNFYSQEREIIWITLDETIHYTVFSVYKTNPSDSYHDLNFSSFKEKTNEFFNKSEISILETMEEPSQILTLSTCHDNNRDRLVVHAYKKNERNA